MTKSIFELDTPALIVDIDIMEKNLDRMQKKADAFNVKLRPHTKTHRTPALAKLQIEMGAKGIAVAKLGEAEVMYEEGIRDIFIPNEIVGSIKLERLRNLNDKDLLLSVAVDHQDHVKMLSEVFSSPENKKKMNVFIDVCTGYPRTGVMPGKDALALAKMIADSPGLHFKGVFTHDGHSYRAADSGEVKEIFRKSQQTMLETAELIRGAGIPVEEISVGSTPSLLLCDEILEGITEIRPGSYIFMDADQASVVGTYEHCAQTVLVTVISRPTEERVVIDAGTKSLTACQSFSGIAHSEGRGRLKEHPEIFLNSISEEHASFDIPEGSGLSYAIGDKIEIISNHACPTSNLFRTIYGVKKGEVVTEWPVLAQSKSQ
ncbi:MAG: alanine racemase [Synergistaceae bacterium]|nr:alanine racemase [Synergistaceae bacterium]